MKRSMLYALALCLGLLTADVAGAVDTYSVGDAAGGIASSRHNLGAFGIQTVTPETTEICVFCHTPHHANTGDLNGLAPLWNRGTTAPTSFTAYGTTAAGTTIDNTDIGSVSLACLSCHDGATTFDNLVNAPGKNGVILAGSSRGWTFTQLGTLVSGFMTAARLNIGLDLSNDHPMSVVYNGGTKASLRMTDTLISSIDLTTDMETSALTYDGGNLTKNLWAVGGYISDTARISDLLRSDVTTGISDRVECSSCHDPHFNNKSFNEVDSTYTTTDVVDLEDESNGLFLRRVGGNSGSGVCRTCHAK